MPRSSSDFFPLFVCVTFLFCFSPKLFVYNFAFISFFLPGEGGGVLPYMGYVGMCRCEGYGFQAVYSSIGYINQRVWV